MIDSVTYKLSLLPSGVVRGKLGIIGNGVVLDPVVDGIARISLVPSGEDTFTVTYLDVDDEEIATLGASLDS